MEENTQTAPHMQVERRFTPLNIKHNHREVSLEFSHF